MMTDRRRVISVKASRAMILACWLVYTVGYLARNTFPASIVALTGRDLLSESSAGLIGTCYFVCYGVGHLINGILADRISPFILILTGLFGTAAANLLMTVITPDLTLMLIVWSLNGFLQAMLWSPIIGILSVTIAPSTRSGALAVISTTAPIGTIVAYLVTSLCSYLGADWAVPYRIAAAASLVTGLVFLSVGRYAFSRQEDTPGVVADPIPGSPEAAAQAGTSAIEAAGTAGIRSDPASPVSRRTLLGFFITSGAFFFLIPVLFHGMLKDGIMTWVPTILRDTYGTSESFSTLLTILLPLVNLIGPLISQYAYEHVFRRNHAAAGAVSMLAAAIPAVLLIRIETLPLTVSVICLSLFSMMMMAFNHLFSALLPARFAFCRRSSTVSGIFNSTIYAGSALSTYGFARIAEYFSWTVTIVIWLAITLLATGVLAALICPWRRFLDRHPEET